MIDSERKMSDNVTIFGFDVVVPFFESSFGASKIAERELYIIDRKHWIIVWMRSVVILEQRYEWPQRLGAVFAQSRTDRRIERHAAHDDNAFLILSTQSRVAAS